MKKSKLALTAMLALLFLSVAGCLFSLVFGQWQDLSRQHRLQTFRDLEGREKAAQALEAGYREWRDLPLVLQKFRRDNILSLDEFAAFRRDLDGLRKVTAKFSLTGSYRSLKKFIFDMEAKSKMHFFSSLQLNAEADRVKGAFSLEVYLGQ
jgi:hypothetical protein